MTLDAVIMLVGALIAYLASPASGFPNSWDKPLLFILGVVVIGLGIVVRRRPPVGGSHQAATMRSNVSQQPAKQTFVEATPANTPASEPKASDHDTV